MCRSSRPQQISAVINPDLTIGAITFRPCRAWGIRGHHRSDSSARRCEGSIKIAARLIEAIRALEAVIVTPPQPSEWELRAVVRDPDGRAVNFTSTDIALSRNVVSFMAI